MKDTTIEVDSVNDELGRKLMKNSIIKSAKQIQNIETAVNKTIVKWFSETKNKVPAIVTTSGDVYMVSRSERSASEAVDYSNLLKICRLIFENITEHQALRNPLETAIKQLDPEFIQRNNRVGSKLIASLIERGIELKATDVHMEIVNDETTIKYRIHGELIEDSVFDGDQGEAVAAAMFNRQIKLPEDGSPAKKGFFHHFTKNSKKSDVEEKWLCRVSYGYSEETNRTTTMVIRLRSMDDIPKLYDLGYLPGQVKDIKIGMNNRGFTMIIGAVNSGKSTTQAAIMDEQPANKKNLEISAETEIMFKNFVQLVLPTNGTPKQRAEWRKRMTALPMQQDVDFLAVNEINTSETANMIASMMMQGTSGISSIHGSGHGDAINRLKNPDELGVSEQILFSDSFFNMVIYQTLVGKLCKNCSLSEHPVGFWNAQLKTQFGERAKKFKFHNPEGCKECEINGRRLGVVGRTLVAEVIPVSQDNRSYLRTPEDSQPMRDWLKETGRDTIHMHALKLALGGIIDPVVIQQKIGHFSKFNLFDKIINLDEKKELKRLEQGKD